LSGGLYNEPTISGFFRYLHVKDAATNSVSLDTTSIKGNRYTIPINNTIINTMFDAGCEQVVNFATRAVNTDAATNSVSLGVSTSTSSKSDLAITATPPWALFDLSLLATNL
jgi:protoheme ferro-lyase